MAWKRVNSLSDQHWTEMPNPAEVSADSVIGAPLERRASRADAAGIMVKRERRFMVRMGDTLAFRGD